MGLNWISSVAAVRARRRADAAPLTDTTDPDLGDSSFPQAESNGLSWPDVVRQLGQEVTGALNTATAQLDRLNRLEPTLVRSLAPLADAVERARQAGMAAQHVLRLCEDPPPQHREVLNLADVARAAITARDDWFKRRQVSVRQGMSQATVYADPSTLYLLIDELLLWATHLSSDIAVTVDKSSRTGQPRLRVVAFCPPATMADPAWRGMRWMLWHQLARAVDAQTRLDTRNDHMRVTLGLSTVTEAQLATAAEAPASPSGVSAVIQGCRVLIVAGHALRRAQCLQALAAYGVVIDVAEDLASAQHVADQRLPDALIYDQRCVHADDIERLRESITQKAGTPPAVIEIHEQNGATEFHASTIGTVSTGYVAASAIPQSLGPALVFELCKVL